MKKITKRPLILILSFILTATVLLSGCGKKAEQDAQSTNTDPSQISATITYWANQDWVDANKQLIDKFESAYPKIKVEVTSFSYDTYIEKIRASYSAKQESDVQQIFGDWATDLMKNGLLDPVPADMASDAKSRYYEAPLAGYSYDGKLYGVPREYNIENGGVLYYPEDLKSVGYSEFPKTFDELMDAAKKLSKQDASGNPTHLGFDFISFDSIPYLFLSFILQQGGDYWAEDKKHVDFTTPEAEKAMQTMVDMVVKDKVTEIKHLNDSNNESHTMFFKGLESMCFRGPWVIPAGINDFKLNNFKYGPMPSFTGNSNAFAAEAGWGDVVSARSKNKEAAWLFIKFITSRENNEWFNSTTYTIPAEKAITEDPAYVEKNPLLKASLDVLQYGKPIGPLQSIDSFKGTVGNYFVSMTSGQGDVKSELQKMEQEINSMIDERLAQ